MPELPPMTTAILSASLPVIVIFSCASYFPAQKQPV
jgi:hypothetical protein